MHSEPCTMNHAPCCLTYGHGLRGMPMSTLEIDLMLRITPMKKNGESIPLNKD